MLGLSIEGNPFIIRFKTLVEEKGRKYILGY